MGVELGGWFGFPGRGEQGRSLRLTAVTPLRSLDRVTRRIHMPVTTAYRLGDLGWSLHLPGPQLAHWLKGHSDVFHRWCSEV